MMTVIARTTTAMPTHARYPVTVTVSNSTAKSATMVTETIETGVVTGVGGIGRLSFIRMSTSDLWHSMNVAFPRVGLIASPQRKSHAAKGVEALSPHADLSVNSRITSA